MIDTIMMNSSLLPQQQLRHDNNDVDEMLLDDFPFFLDDDGADHAMAECGSDPLILDDFPQVQQPVDDQDLAECSLLLQGMEAGCHKFNDDDAAMMPTATLPPSMDPLHNLSPLQTSMEPALLFPEATATATQDGFMTSIMTRPVSPETLCCDSDASSLPSRSSSGSLNMLDSPTPQEFMPLSTPSVQDLEQCAQRLLEAMRRTDETRMALREYYNRGGKDDATAAGSNLFHPTSTEFQEVQMERAKLYESLPRQQQ